MATIPLPALHGAPIQAPQSPLETYAQILGIQKQQQASQMAQQEAPVRQQILGQQAQSGALELQQQQQAQQDQQTFRSAMADPANKGKSIGDIADTLADSGHISPQTWQGLKKADIEQRTALATLDDKQLQNAKAAHSATQELYNNVMDMPDDQLAQNWPSIAQQYDAIPGNNKQPLNPQQPLTKQQLQQFGPMISMQDAYLTNELDKRTKQTKLQADQAELGQKQAETQFYQQNGGAPGVPVEAQQQADWLKKNPGKGPSDYKLWTLKNSPSAAVLNNVLGGDKNSDALDFAANNYRQTGQMPAGFSRSPQTTSAIIARAAELDKQAGGSGIAANKDLLAANTNSLKKLQGNFDQVSAFEGTAGKNLDLYIDKLSKIPDLGGKFANVPLRMIDDKMIGTDNYQAMKAAQQTAAAEAAKVLSSANASGVLSDTQKKEAEDMLSGNLTLSAAKQVVATLKQDFSNRHQSYQQQIADIQQRIKNAGGAQSQPATGQPASSGDPFAQFGGKAHQ